MEANALRAAIRQNQIQPGTEQFDWAVARIYELEREAEGSLHPANTPEAHKILSEEPHGKAVLGR